MSAITPDLLARARGALLGAAVGDAFGMALEGAPPRQPDRLLRDMAPGRLPMGHFTEGTGAMLTVGEQLLAEQPLDSEDLAKQLAVGARSQQGGARLAVSLADRLFPGRSRACQDAGAWAPPGRSRACTLASSTAPRGRRRRDAPSAPPEPEHADAGPLVRAIPITLANLRLRAACLGQAEEVVRLTHSHPDCVAGTALLAAMLWHLVNGMEPRQALQQAVYARAEFPSGLTEVMRTAASRRRDQLAADGQVASVLERVVNAIITTASFGEALTRVANVGGEAAAAGALLGALAGAAYRHRGIPAHWREQVHGTWPPRSGALWRERELVVLAEQLVEGPGAAGVPTPYRQGLCPPALR